MDIMNNDMKISEYYSPGHALVLVREGSDPERVAGVGLWGETA